MLYRCLTSLCTASVLMAAVSAHADGSAGLPKSIAFAVVTQETVYQQYDGVVGFGAWKYEEDLAGILLDERIEAAMLFELGRMNIQPVPLRVDRAKLRSLVYREGATTLASVFGKMFVGIDDELNQLIGSPHTDAIVLVVQAQRATVTMHSRGDLIGSAAEGRAVLQLDMVLLDPATKRIRKFVPLREAPSDRHWSDMQEMKRGGVPTIQLAGEMAKTSLKQWAGAQRSWFFDYFTGNAVRVPTEATVRRLFLQ